MTWLRRHAKVLLVLYSTGLAIALLSPGSEEQSGLVWWLVVRLRDLGAPASVVDFPRAEVLMNAVIVIPVSFLGGLWRPSSSWRDWTAYGFCAAVAVEVLQAWVLPARQPAFSDIVANTAGACAGALLVGLVLRRGRTWGRARPGAAPVLTRRVWRAGRR